jgi:hypothetical protein
MHSTRRKVLDEGDAHELLDAFEASQVPFTAFCVERGVDGRSLQWWREKLRRGRRSNAPVRLVELTTTPAAATTTRASYRVVLGGVTIEVDDAFREDTLVRLLAVVGGC